MTIYSARDCGHNNVPMYPGGCPACKGTKNAQRLEHLEAENAELKATVARLQGAYDPAKYDAALTENANLRAELDAQARIVGMGGEREARLMAQVSEHERTIAKLREALEDLSSCGANACSECFECITAALASTCAGQNRKG